MILSQASYAKNELSELIEAENWAELKSIVKPSLKLEDIAVWDGFSPKPHSTDTMFFYDKEHEKILIQKNKIVFSRSAGRFVADLKNPDNNVKLKSITNEYFIGKYNGRWVIQSPNSAAFSFYNPENMELVKKISTEFYHPKIYAKNNGIIYITASNRRASKGKILEINLDTMTVKPAKIITSALIKTLQPYRQEEKYVQSHLNHASKFSKLADKFSAGSPCTFTYQPSNLNVEFTVVECGGNEPKYKDPKLKFISLGETHTVIRSKSRQGNWGYGATDYILPLSALDNIVLSLKEKKHHEIKAQLKLFSKNIPFDQYDTSKLRGLAKALPEYINPKQLEAELASYYTARAKDQYGLNVLESIKAVDKGSRYVPTVTSTYYTHEDQSYSINGQYVHKTGPSKSNQVNSGGYDQAISGFDLVFAIDNTKKKSYQIELEANWTAAESYNAKESYCMQRGFIFCSQRGTRNVTKYKTQSKKVKQSYLIGHEGRIKHKFYLGEKQPSDLIFYISSVKPVDDQHFSVYENIMSNSHDEELNVTKELIDQIKQQKLFLPFHGSLDDRFKALVQQKRDQFFEQQLPEVSLNFQFPEKFDPDFDNNVKVSIISQGMPVKIDLETNKADHSYTVNQKTSGFEVAQGYCFFCEYSKEINLNFKGMSKAKIQDTVKIKYLYGITDNW